MDYHSQPASALAVAQYLCELSHFRNYCRCAQFCESRVKIMRDFQIFSRGGDPAIRQGEGSRAAILATFFQPALPLRIPLSCFASCGKLEYEADYWMCKWDLARLVMAQGRKKNVSLSYLRSSGCP